MLNIDLLSKEDIEKLLDKIPFLEKEIIRLKNIISDFKKYDSERKKYYKNSLIRLGELESYCQELEEEINKIPDKKAIKDLRVQIEHYRTLYNQEVRKNKCLMEKETLEPELMQLEFYKSFYLKQKQKESYKSNEIAAKNKVIKRLKEYLANLIYKLNQYENKQS